MSIWDKFFGGGSITNDATLNYSEYAKMIQDKYQQDLLMNQQRWVTTSSHTTAPPTVHRVSAAELEARQLAHAERMMNHDGHFQFVKGELLRQVFSVWDSIIPNEHKVIFVQGIDVSFHRDDPSFSFVARLKFDMPGSVAPIDLHIRFQDGQIQDRNIPDMRKDIEQWLIKARMLKEIADNKDGQHP